MSETNYVYSYQNTLLEAGSWLRTASAFPSSTSARLGAGARPDILNLSGVTTTLVVCNWLFFGFVPYRNFDCDY
jgi:hypothetical protein